MEKIKVILVEDHDLVRDGIKSLINEDNIAVIGEASSARDFFTLLKIDLPDVAVLDINLPDQSGIEICRKLNNDFPKVKTIMLSMYLNEDYIFNSVKAGALGYLPKNTTKKELIDAIHNVNDGREYFSTEVSNIILKSYVKKAKHQQEDTGENKELSKREKEILKLFAEGKSNPEIAEKLFISTRTVESHKTHIMQKLSLKSSVELIKFAIKNNIINI